MVPDTRLARLRAETFVEQVLAPASLSRRGAFDVRVAQFEQEQRDPAAVLAAEFKPVELGWRWGPKGSTAWFRLSGSLPADVDPADLRIAFSSGTEALLWKGDASDGVAWHGFDANRDEAPLWSGLEAGGRLDLWFEAACNHPLGSETFFWDAPEVHARWSEERPGRLERAEWILPRTDVRELSAAMLFAAETLDELGDGSARARRLIAALEDVYRAVGSEPTEANCKSAMLDLFTAWRSGGAPTESRCFPVGHAHLDTAWLWPIAETRRKALRTFSSALHSLADWDGHRFLATQPQQLAWVREDAPALFDRIQAQIESGRWQARGAMWIEPDGQVPSAESYCQQLIHGQRYLREAFEGSAAEAGEAWVRTLFLPDTFGFNPGLPQIARLGGIDLFVTNKLWWSEQNVFPHVHFTWRGLDGSELLSHLTPGQDYNAKLTAEELRRGERVLAERDKLGVGLWLQPYGFGDGGGGPSEGQRQREAWLQASTPLAELPAAESGGLDAFREAYQHRVADLQAQGRTLPVWDGELYLELHRGTLTSQARLKQWHARVERDMRALELAVFGSPFPTADQPWIAQHRERWQRLLVQQFHDILPGSGVRSVVEDAEAELQALVRECREALEHFARELAGHLPTGGMQQPMLVLNSSGQSRTGVLALDEGPRRLNGEVPAWGWRLLDAAELNAPSRTTATVAGSTAGLENEHMRVGFDRFGRVTELRHKGLERDAVPLDASGEIDPLHAWELYDDHPRRWEAWDLDEETLAHGRRVEDPNTSVQVTDDGQGVLFEFAVGRASRARVTYRLRPEGSRLEIDTEIDWKEERTLLRARFPVAVRARHATFEVTGGHLERPTTRNTSVERAAFEVPVQRYFDLSERGFGLTVYNAFRYGASAEGHVLGLSLLRATRWPDADAERGEHRWSLALEPHAGDLGATRPWVQAEAHCDPLVAIPLQAGAGTPENPEAWSPFEIECPGAADVQVLALSPGWKSGVCLRLIERAGGRGPVNVLWRNRPAEVDAVDLLEQRVEGDLAPDFFEHDLQAGFTRLHLRPFQIVTLWARIES